MIARLLGMAKLEVVGAGADANVKLEYLSTANAEAVRADILRLASGRRLAEAAARSGAPAARTSRVAALGADGQPRASPDSSRATRPRSPCPSRSCTSRSAGSSHPTSSAPRPSSSSSRPIAVVVGVVAGRHVAAVRLRARAHRLRRVLGALDPPLAALLDRARPPTACGSRSACSRRSPRSCRPGAIHAVEITQSILWRPPAGGSIRINRLSGRSATDSNTDQFTTVLPVGTAADVERVLRLLLPVGARGGVAAHRAARASSARARTTPSRRLRGARGSSARCRGGATASASPTTCCCCGAASSGASSPILPLARLQSFALHQGPIDRMLRVAIGARSTSSRVRCTRSSPRSTAIDALRLFEDVARGAVRAASGDRSHRWARMPTPASTRTTACRRPSRSRSSPNSRRRARSTVGRSASSDARRTPRRRGHRRRPRRTGDRGGARRRGPRARRASRTARTTRASRRCCPGVPAARRARGRAPQRTRRRSPCRTTSSRASCSDSPRSARGSRDSSCCTPTPHSAPASSPPPSRRAPSRSPSTPRSRSPAPRSTGGSSPAPTPPSPRPRPVLPIAQALAVELGCEPVVVAEDDRAAYAEGDRHRDRVLAVDRAPGGGAAAPGRRAESRRVPLGARALHDRPRARRRGVRVG